jgi:hypothetical protein
LRGSTEIHFLVENICQKNPLAFKTPFQNLHTYILYT